MFECEMSLCQVIDCVVGMIVCWGCEDGYFEGDDVKIFEQELCILFFDQFVCFNLFVWFNVGIFECLQCSVCFINLVEDSMFLIMKFVEIEVLFFKFGLGMGSNLLMLCGFEELFLGGGILFGLVLFMCGYDFFVGVVKSGGCMWCVVKMVIFDVDYLDIVEFIECKEVEECKVWVFIEQGYDGGFNVLGGVYDLVFFQNVNYLVCVLDEFMEVVEEDVEWVMMVCIDGFEVGCYLVWELFQKIVQLIWVCGDLGMQFDSVINCWYICKESGCINSSNLCFEYMFFDDMVCNLVLFNLLCFEMLDGGFDVECFVYVCEVVIIVQEILVDCVSYLMEKIEVNFYFYCLLGFGYVNFGVLFMCSGQFYDLDVGCNIVVVIIVLFFGVVYWQLGCIVVVKGVFVGYEENCVLMMGVMEMYCDVVFDFEVLLLDVVYVVWDVWQDMVIVVEGVGLCNSQIFVFVFIGIIVFMMDCDIIGVELDIGLVKYKMFVGGGMLKIVNYLVEMVLQWFGYDESVICSIFVYIEEYDMIEGVEVFNVKYFVVFDCVFKVVCGMCLIYYMGYFKMFVVVQLFILGVISKMINLFEYLSVEDIVEIYFEVWCFGFKVVVIYCDGCKCSQLLLFDKKDVLVEVLVSDVVVIVEYCCKLLDECQVIIYKFVVGGQEGYIIVGFFEDGQFGEIFFVMVKEGFVILGFMDVFVILVLIVLQFGVLLCMLICKFLYVCFELLGFILNKCILMVKLIVDYIFCWFGLKFFEFEEQEVFGVLLELESLSVLMYQFLL